MGSQLFPENLATLPAGPLSTGSAGLLESDPMKTLKASSTPPGYSICAWQCSPITNCYCISPRDILGSSQAGSSNAGTGTKLPKESCRAAGQVATVPSLFSVIHALPKAARSASWPPYPLSAWLQGATTFVFSQAPLLQPF